MYSLFISRQPIFCQHTRVAYYELVGASHRGASNAELIATITEVGIGYLTRGRPALIALRAQPTGAALPDWPFASDASVGVSYPLTSAPNERPGEILIPYSDAAAFVCLDDFILSDGIPAHPGRGLIVRLDAKALGPDGVADQMQRLRHQPVEIGVKNVANADEFELYRAMGVDLFQGSFLAAPRPIATPRVVAGQASALALLASLQGDPDTDELREIIARDVTLSYKLLRYLNSAAFGLRRRFKSVREAIIYLGRRPLRRWASLVVIASLGAAPEELRRQALVRARLCEQVGAKFGEPSPETYFTTGLFSLLDALLDRSMDEVLATLPLHDNVAGALERGEGPLGEALACARDHEQARWRAERYLALGPRDIAPTYAEATDWADDVMRLIGER